MTNVSQSTKQNSADLQEYTTQLQSFMLGNLTCTHCLLRCESREALQQHKLVEHNLVVPIPGKPRVPVKQDEEAKYYCYHCSFETPKTRTIRWHLRELHHLPNFYKCSCCDASYRDQMLLAKHLMENHRKTKWFVCPFTTTEFRSEQALKLYVQRSQLYHIIKQGKHNVTSKVDDS
jgi:hypothetical protein